MMILTLGFYGLFVIFFNSRSRGTKIFIVVFIFLMGLASYCICNFAMTTPYERTHHRVTAPVVDPSVNEDDDKTIKLQHKDFDERQI